MINWDAIGAVGEIIGAFAVVVSLAYLAIQIKQNSGISKSVAIQHWASASALEKSSIFTDPDFAELIAKGTSSFNDLNPTERLRFRNYVIQTINSFELLYFQWQNNTIDETFFAGKQDSYLSFIQLPGVHQLWQDIGEQQAKKDVKLEEINVLEAEQGASEDGAAAAAPAN